MAPLYPRLAGQYAAYATAQFEAFRGGSRKNDVGAVMRDIARNLPDEDVTAVANYLESLRPGEKASP
jgi:cytochrome c553